jgi:hypothetical protein
MGKAAPTGSTAVQVRKNRMQKNRVIVNEMDGYLSHSGAILGIRYSTPAPFISAIVAHTPTPPCLNAVKCVDTSGAQRTNNRSIKQQQHLRNHICLSFSLLPSIYNATAATTLALCCPKTPSKLLPFYVTVLALQGKTAKQSTWHLRPDVHNPSSQILL